MASVSANKTSFSCSDVGRVAVLLTASDPSGITASTGMTVVVGDSIASQVRTAGNVTMELNSAGSYSLTVQRQR